LIILSLKADLFIRSGRKNIDQIPPDGTGGPLRGRHHPDRFLGLTSENDCGYGEWLII
jgi:hypothetical protein